MRDTRQLDRLNRGEIDRNVLQLDGAKDTERLGANAVKFVL